MKPRRKTAVIFPTLDHAYRYALKIADVQNDKALSPPLTLRERLIFTLGIIAEKDRAKGVWRLPTRR